MKKSLVALVATLALTLTACGGQEEAPAPPQVASSPTAEPTPTPSAKAVEASPATPSESGSKEYEACLADMEQTDKANGEPFDEDFAHLFCGDMQEVSQQLDDEIGGMVEGSPRWQCWLELEETRPELFVSADPEQYSKDPEVIKACG